MIGPDDRLSIGTLLRVFRAKIAMTWGLTLVETALFAFLPLLIGYSIDGLSKGDYTSFTHFGAVMAALLVVATLRRIYDTRAYGTIRVELGKAQAMRDSGQEVSVLNARVLMARELVDFLEGEAPESMGAAVQVLVSIGILMSFHGALATAAGLAAALIVIIFTLFSRRFFRLNGLLNQQSERQVTSLQSNDLKKIGQHLFRLRAHEVRLSDSEAYVYGAIFAVLLSMLAFNLWFAATQSQATAGQIFSVVTYSFEFVQSVVVVPMVLQSLARLSEITERINAPASGKGANA
ncbi:ABC transporter six-transmembrane domain-containing protein [Ruegeria sp. Ofav3-42]|uniref:ABC transporter six-transmembrane domain-containing protein n=1 Tax=Ruegeria sp. Ofav3-42 TaxID=2917759 RepID=UPI001EF55A83|nr:ABC transporter six-transmembrane domain-containing protein [Ruegeria sp. Ofav3-42]MCG7519951.1 ABC transporter six-transmembrane domain-containing protein [Ruegeria sp. Ofav3-42]